VCVCFGCDLFLYFDFAKMKLYVCVVIFEKWNWVTNNLQIYFDAHLLLLRWKWFVSNFDFDSIGME
jgi:hypothetical protein